MKENSMEMKQKVLDMLREFMLGESGKQFKPKAIEVEMVGKPHIMSAEKEGLGDVLKAASKAPMGEEEDWGHPEPDGDEIPMSEVEGELPEEEEEAKPMSLKEYLASRH